MLSGIEAFRIEGCQATWPISAELIHACFPHNWRLFKPAYFRGRWDLGPFAIEIPTLYECDGASIPFRFYDVVDPINALPGSFLHDLLYETQGGFRTYKVAGNTYSLLDFDTGNPFLIDSDPDNPTQHERRARADALLQAFWLWSGMPERMAEKGYLAVRLFGRKSWDDKEMVPVDKTYAEAMREIIV